MTKQLEFVFHGVDTTSGTYVAWESEDCPPAFVVLDRKELVRVTQALRRSLPDYMDDDDQVTGAQVERLERDYPPLPARPDVGTGPEDDDDEMARFFDDDDEDETASTATPDPLEVGHFLRVVDGALAGDPERELELMRDLAQVLVPPGFLASLLEAVDTPGQRVLLAVNPPPSCGQVPWELMPTGRTTPDGKVERFLDVLDVVTMGPVLGRDSEPSLPHPSWERVRDAPAVYLVQPWQQGAGRAGVLNGSELAAWEERVRGYEPAPVTVGSAPAEAGGRGDARGTTRLQLSAVLRQDPDVVTVDNRRPLSHLLYVGHMTGKGGDSRLQLADSRACYGVYPTDQEGTRWFSASDLVLGTIDWREHAAKFRNTARAGQEPDLGDLLPTGVGFDGTDMSGAPAPEAHSGIYLWPMPPRVGLVACQSGTETGQVEPFGMAAAILEAGAELVMTTRWTMLTDEFFRRACQEESARGFLDLSFAVDDCLRAPDAVLAMNEWKRGCLAVWRERPGIVTSPLTWAGLNAYWAPDRSFVPDAGDEGGGESGGAGDGVAGPVGAGVA